MLSKYLVSCTQETKFADRTHLSNFKFHLDSGFKHKVFVDDTNSLLDPPTRGRSNGVLTVLRSDFPGYNSAVEVPGLAVPGRYLVVKLMVDSAPVYIYNVDAPVERQEKMHLFSSLDTRNSKITQRTLLLAISTPL